MGTPAASASSPIGGKRELRLLTYNVLASPIFLGLRTPALLRLLQRSDADLMALQEVTPELLAVLAAEPWVQRGYHLTRRQDLPFAPGGQLILSRRPFVRVHAATLTGRQRRTVLQADIRIDGRTLSLATTHMESFLDDGPVRARQLTALFGMLEDGDDAILAGDLNFGDGEQPETRHLDPRYEDVWLALHSGDPGHTWDNERNDLARVGAFAGEPNRRLDRILIRSSHWRVKDVRIIGDRSVGRRRLTRGARALIEMPERADPSAAEEQIEVHPSDHFGLIATFEWNGGPGPG